MTGYTCAFEFINEYPLITHIHPEETNQIPVLCRPGTERDIEVTFSLEAVAEYLEIELKLENVPAGFEHRIRRSIGLNDGEA